ncbi:MAG: ArsR family transcriptional regulator [Actinomycetes bacterium]
MVPARRGAALGTTRPHTDRRQAVLGVTRSRIMRTLAERAHTTSSLSASVGISPASASTHAAALPEDGGYDRHAT